MTKRDTDSLTWSLDFTARRLAGAFDLAFPGGAAGSHMLRAAWAAACREVRYLEMMVRRLLVFMAGRLAVEALPGGPALVLASQPQGRFPPLSPNFALNERLATLAQIQAMMADAPPARSAGVFDASGQPAP
ncbi:MAG: hypothetical protein AAFO88_08490, partial [Pseudomonadota bacterium]